MITLGLSIWRAVKGIGGTGSGGAVSPFQVVSDGQVVVSNGESVISSGV